MKRIAKFHKVSEKRFLEDWKDTFPDAEEEEIKKIYADILLPERATACLLYTSDAADEL